jgi:hypothetical protein
VSSPAPATADPATALAAAVKVAASLGVQATEPEILNDGANVIVRLGPSPVVAKVAASTAAVRTDGAAWLQRELDVASFLAAAGASWPPTVSRSTAVSWPSASSSGACT